MGLAVGSISVIGMFAEAKRVDLVRSTTLYAYRWAFTIAITSAPAPGWRHTC